MDVDSIIKFFSPDLKNTKGWRGCSEKFLGRTKQFSWGSIWAESRRVFWVQGKLFRARHHSTNDDENLIYGCRHARETCFSLPDQREFMWGTSQNFCQIFKPLPCLSTSIPNGSNLFPWNVLRYPNILYNQSGCRFNNKKFFP